MPFVEGYLDEKISVGPGRPSHPIAPGGPVDPGYGVPGPVDPGYGVPLPPVTIWPSPGTPTHPIVLPPTYPVAPDQGLPQPPTVWPLPPHPVDPGYGVPVPIGPDHPIYYPPVGPNNDLPLPPGAVWPPLPPYVSTGPVGQLMCFVWIPGIGYRWTTIDVNLKPEHPIVPGPPVYPAHPIAPGGTPPTTPPPGTPTHPIAPGGTPPTQPGTPPAPTHPIAPTPEPKRS
jgi:hypothetical protein